MGAQGSERVGETMEASGGAVWGAPPWARWMVLRRIVRGWFVRIVATASILLATFVAGVVFLAFEATRFAWYQDLAIVIVMIALALASIAAMWASWAWRLRRHLLGPWLEGW